MTNAFTRGLYRILIVLTGSLALLSHSARAMDYPDARRGDVVDDYNGVKVADPYRWMEDLGSDELRSWINSEVSLTTDYLAGIPGRDDVYAEMMQRVDYERYSAPAERNGRYFYTRNDGLQNQSPVYMTQGLDGAEQLQLDPNTFSSDSSISLQTWLPSDSGRYILYALSDSGSDWCIWHVYDVDKRADLEDVVQWGKFSGADWGAADAGFYYLRFPEPAPGEEHTVQNHDQATWYHRLGTPQSEDELIYSLPEHPSWWVSSGLNEQRDLLITYVSDLTSNGNMIYLQDPQHPGAGVQKLIEDPRYSYSFVGNEGDRLWFTTSLDAPNSRLVEIDRKHPEPQNWKTIIPEGRFPLSGVSLVGNRFICSYLQDARSVVRIHSLDGSLERDLRLPGVGSVGGFGGRRDSTETFYSYTDMTTPGTIYRYDLASGESAVFRSPNVGIDPANYEGKLLFYRSHDGTAVPMFLVHRRGIELDGSNPTVLYGYGGFGSSQSPYFSSSRTVWMDMGGVWAIACIRGGAEYGEDWHTAAIKTHRQVAYDDFIAAAEFLIDSGYTSTPKLAVMGGSNGGLLVGAVMTQRPDLFAVALPQVGVMDMLRFNRFTAGASWESDFGSPQIPEEFAAIYAYSPLHNLHEGSCYPATLATTADTDDRVVPSHSFKFMAELQRDQACDNPVLIRIETQAGHGAGKPLAKSIAEFADELCFALHNMDVDIPAALERFR